MSVAFRYINREMLAVFAVSLLFLLLVAVGGRFINYLQEAALGKFTGTTVLTIIYLRLPEFVQLVAPFSLYVAVVLTMGRLYAEQEMVVLQSAGAGTAKLLKWCSFTVVGVALLVALLTLYLTPKSQQALEDFMAVQQAQTEFETVNAGIFHVYDGGRRVTYSQSMTDDRRVLQDVFMAQRLADGRSITTWAASGRQRIDPVSGSHYLVLNDGKRYEGTPGTSEYRVIEFQELRQRLNTNDRARRTNAEAASTWELGNDAEANAEWHWRLALPLFCLIGGLLGLGISRVKPRQGRFARIVPGMAMMLLYYLGLLINRNALAEENLPAILGLWVVHAVFLAVALYYVSGLNKPVRA